MAKSAAERQADKEYREMVKRNEARLAEFHRAVDAGEIIQGGKGRTGMVAAATRAYERMGASERNAHCQLGGLRRIGK